MNWLISRKATVMVEFGRTIFNRLRFDSRLTQAATAMEPIQAKLEARVQTWDEARAAAGRAIGNRDDVRRILVGTLREFGFTILSVTGNHHSVDPYLRYFPNGYGDIRYLDPLRLIEFTWALLYKLDAEPEPKIVAGREPITSALTAFLTVQQDCETAISTRNKAFDAMQVEKRAWVRGMRRVRSIAEEACYFEKAYLRSIFAPLMRRRRPSPGEIPEDGGEGEGESEGGVPAEVLESAASESVAPGLPSGIPSTTEVAG